jgi:hypothetical protein
MKMLGSTANTNIHRKGPQMILCNNRPRSEPSREMLISPVLIDLPDQDLTYSTAKAIADSKAFSINSEAMLLAWFDKKTGEFSPRVE